MFKPLSLLLENVVKDPDSELVARNNTCKMALRNMCVFETVNTGFANVTSSLFQRPMAMTKLNLTSFVFMYISICVQELNIKISYIFSDQNFSLVIVLMLFLIFGQISAWVFL